MKNKFNNIIDELIELNWNNRQLVDKYSMSHYAWLKEFCTIKIDIGRRSGKTTFINHFPKDSQAVIIPSNHLKHMYLDYFNKEDVYTVSYFNKANRPYEYIFMDECGLNEEFDISEIYDIFGNKRIEQTFVILGES